MDFILQLGDNKAETDQIDMRVTPPLLVRSIQGGFRRYAVRKGSVRSTQTFCYIVRRHQFLLQKGPIFIKKTQHMTYKVK